MGRFDGHRITGFVFFFIYFLSLCCQHMPIGAGGGGKGSTSSLGEKLCCILLLVTLKLCHFTLPYPLLLFATMTMHVSRSRLPSDASPQMAIGKYLLVLHSYMCHFCLLGQH